MKYECYEIYMTTNIYICVSVCICMCMYEDISGFVASWFFLEQDAALGWLACKYNFGLNEKQNI